MDRDASGRSHSIPLAKSVRLLFKMVGVGVSLLVVLESDQDFEFINELRTEEDDELFHAKQLSRITGCFPDIS